MRKIRTLIVEDEHRTRIVLVELITMFCPTIEIIGEADNVAQAVIFIEQHKPELIFLDIKLGDGTGFDVLKNCKTVNFDVIFTTAYENYALKAIKHSCIDYLMKPIDINELKVAVSKIKPLINHEIKKGDVFIQKFDERKPFERIGLPTKEGIQYIETDKIVFFQADGPYTHIHFADNGKTLISKTLKYFSEMLDENVFKRTHRSFIVNTKYIERYERIDGGCLVLKSGKVIPISRRLKSNLLDNLK